MADHVTSAQMRAARGLVNWSVRDLSEKSGVHRNTITNFETGKSGGDAETQKALINALERAGVEFTNGGQPGVRLKIFEDAARPATLILPDGKQPCLTLGEAVVAWANLRPTQKAIAVIKTEGGVEYGADEIDRLHHRRKQ